MPPENKHLTVEHCAQLFSQLYRLESAGLPAFQAFTVLLQAKTPVHKTLMIMQQKLKMGYPIAEAGFKAGVFNNSEKALIQAAEASGQLTAVYARLAENYTRRSRHLKQIKARLYFPALMLSLSILLGPLPALAAAEISTLQYLVLSLGRLLSISAGVLLLFKLPSLLNYLGLNTVWHRLQLRIPGLTQWLVKREINRCFSMLAMLLQSGLAFSDAFPNAVATIQNSCLRARFKPALSVLGTGISVADTLAKVEILSPTLLQIAHTSEQSGRLGPGLDHYTQLEAENIKQNDDALAQWFPRLVYVGVVLWMAYTLLGSPIGTLLPADL
ncbi:MAG: type II secretion system F family protein [Methylococcaceae bacterium]|jgi:general secretion pathway protein F